MSSANTVQLHDIFRFLAQAMRYPDKNWFNDNFLSIYSSLLENLEWEEKNSFISLYSDKYLERLQVEYTRLFITGMPNVIAPPYASVYLDERMNGETTDKTRQFYICNGVDSIDHDLPDHISTELDFAAYLEQEEAGASEKFIEEFFRPWFEIFKSKVLQEKTENYFIITVQLIDFFTCPEPEK